MLLYAVFEQLGLGATPRRVRLYAWLVRLQVRLLALLKGVDTTARTGIETVLLFRLHLCCQNDSTYLHQHSRFGLQYIRTFDVTNSGKRDDADSETATRGAAAGGRKRDRGDVEHDSGGGSSGAIDSDGGGSSDGDRDDGHGDGDGGGRRLRRHARNDALITGGPRDASDACQAINARRHDEQPDIPSRGVLTSRYLCTDGVRDQPTRGGPGASFRENLHAHAHVHVRGS